MGKKETLGTILTNLKKELIEDPLFQAILTSNNPRELFKKKGS